MAETYDIVIIGGGAAGFTTGVYAARDRCTTLVIERMAAGGQVLSGTPSKPPLGALQSS